MEKYYQKFIDRLPGYTIAGLFDGNRDIDQIKTLQTGDRGRVFFFDQEPMIKKLDEPLWQYLNQEPTVFANSELNSLDKKYAFARYKNLVDWYYFSHAFVAREWFSPQTFTTANSWPNLSLEDQIDLAKKSSKFIVDHDFLLDCNLCTGWRQYRVALLYHLSKQGLLEKAYYSFNANQPWFEDLNQWDAFDLLQFDDLKLHIPQKSTSYDQFGFSRHDRDPADLDAPQWIQNIIPIDHLRKTHFVLVAETVFNENKQHLTEKIFKPIAAGKPFILAGGYQNLEYLRNYGYETFDSLWDESYDTIQDPTARLAAIVDLVKWFCNLPKEDKFAITFKSHEISLRNWQRFWFACERVPTREACDNLEQAKIKLAELRQV